MLYACAIESDIYVLLVLSMLTFDATKIQIPSDLSVSKTLNNAICKKYIEQKFCYNENKTLFADTNVPSRKSDIFSNCIITSP